MIEDDPFFIALATM